MIDAITLKSSKLFNFRKFQGKQCFWSHCRHMFLLFQLLLLNTKSSRPEVFCKKSAIKNLAKLTGKYLCWILFFNKVAGLWPATILKKKLRHRFFAVNFAKFLRTSFLYNTSNGCYYKTVLK